MQFMCLPVWPLQTFYNRTADSWLPFGAVYSLACLLRQLVLSKDCMSFSGGSVVKNLLANSKDSGSIPGSGRSPGEGNSNPFQYFWLAHPMDRGAVSVYSPWGHRRVSYDLAAKQQRKITYGSPCSGHPDALVWGIGTKYIIFSKLCFR